MILKCDGCLLGVGLGLEVGAVEVLEVVGVVVDLLADGVALVGLEGQGEGHLLYFDGVVDGLVDVEVEVAFVGEAGEAVGELPRVEDEAVG